jgi:hypothetical protein
MSPADTVVGKLEGVQGRGPRWRALCPAHESKHRTRSLAVFEADDGRVLLKCHAGCDVQAICGALGLSIDDLFPPRRSDDQRPAPVKKPWAARDVIAALRAETMIGWLLLTDIANGKVVTRSDRERAKLAAERAAHLMLELERAS